MTAPAKPAKEGDDGDEEEGGGDEEPEEPPAALASLEEDKTPTLKKMWIFRAVPKGPHAIITATNLNWPGAFAVCKGKKWANIYVGFGHKYLPGLFTPPKPPAIQNEFKATFDVRILFKLFMSLIIIFRYV